jgi:hypothetical protein
LQIFKDIILSYINLKGMDMKAYLEAYEKQTGDYLKVHRLFAERVLEFGASQRGLVTNGQVNMGIIL